MARFRPRLKYSLSTLFVLMTVVCVWLGYHMNWIHERHVAVDGPDSKKLLAFESNGEVPAPLGLRLFGEPGFRQVFIFVADDDHPTEQELAYGREIEALFPEADFTYTHAVGLSLEPIGGWKMMHGGSGFF